MRRDTFAYVLKQLNDTKPFQPFTVELVNSVRYIARNPEVIILDGDLASFGELDDATEYFDANSVVRVVPVIIPPGAE